MVDIIGLNSNTDYAVTVAAVNGAGTGTSSDMIFVPGRSLVILSHWFKLSWFGSWLKLQDCNYYNSIFASVFLIQQGNFQSLNPSTAMW